VTFCLEIIREALQQVGADLADVVRTRTIPTRIEDYEGVMLVHGEFFKEIRPAGTVMQITYHRSEDTRAAIW
jgi:enamine deaminase RidA (YjgF/YER057c/UK114 family)